MASQPRTTAREDERRHQLRTLVVASAASALAAVVVSQFWIAGTWMAAALTPVLVTLISELLHRPTSAIANRFTTESDAVLPEAGGAGPPPRARDDALPTRAPAEPGSEEAQPPAPPVSVYRSGGGRPRARRKIAIGVIAATAAVAFAISAIAITGTELITGGSIGKGSHRTTLLGGAKDEDKTTTEEQDTTAPSDQDTDQQNQDPDERQTTPQPRDTAPEQQPTAPEEQPQETTPVPAPPSAPPTTTTP